MWNSILDLKRGSHCYELCNSVEKYVHRLDQRPIYDIVLPRGRDFIQRFLALPGTTSLEFVSLCYLGGFNR